MPVRVGLLSTAHVHAYGYASILPRTQNVQFVGVWDDHQTRGETFAQNLSTRFFKSTQEFFDNCDAVIIVSENMRHAEMIEWAASKEKAILCEKPIAATKEHIDHIRNTIQKSGVLFMIAHPCRFSPVYQRLKSKINEGEIGKVLAICATNNGRCPMGWFVEPALSGGGAMMDHVVHVADLMRNLLKAEPTEVYAQTNSRHFNANFDDSAILHVKFDNGVFTTIDSSWSRPESYKTWGNVRMNVVGEKGVIEMDMFAQTFDVYQNTTQKHSQRGFGSNIDQNMINHFIECITQQKQPETTLEDGLKAANISILGYESAQKNLPVSISN